MAASVIQLRSSRPGAFQTLVGHGRGNRTRVTLDINDALAAPLEGIATAEEAELQFGRIINAAIANNRGAVISLAEYGQGRAARARAEFARMAGDIEPGGDAA